MEPLLDRLPAGARVLLVRLRSLGDCVLTTPAVEILKSHRPDLRLGLMVEPRFSAVFEGNPDVEHILDPRPAWPGDLCLNLHGGTRSMFLTATSRARWRAGFAHFRAPWIYNVRIPTAQQILGVSRKVHTAEHLASAIFYLGAPQREIPRARLFVAPAPSTRSYAILHPFASAPAKTWPAERFVELGRALGLEAVIIGGVHDDFAPFAGFRTLRGAPLKEVMSLIAGSSLLVGNDSGPAHVAAALGTPLVALFGASDPLVWSPWKAHSRMLVAVSGMSSISVTEVLKAIDSLKVAA